MAAHEIVPIAKVVIFEIYFLRNCCLGYYR